MAVGISGGVDSSVAALLLKQQGHDVIGVHMTNWDQHEEASEAAADCADRERKDAMRVCRQLHLGFHEVSSPSEMPPLRLGVPLPTRSFADTSTSGQVNFVREYWQRVFVPFVQGYRDGRTPNPDVECNRHIKFDQFQKHVLSLGADQMATGHYARLRRAPCGQMELRRGLDPSKDQSYFLAMVGQQPLERSLFPLGRLMKEEVRQLARESGLHTADKKDSTGICFVGKRRCAISTLAWLMGLLDRLGG